MITAIEKHHAVEYGGAHLPHWRQPRRHRCSPKRCRRRRAAPRGREILPRINKLAEICRKRGALVSQCAAILTDHIEELARLIALETGKALRGDVTRVITFQLARETSTRTYPEIGVPDAAVPTLRSLAYGGAPMPARIIERALALLPTTDFVNAYGLTETSSTVAILGPDDHRLALYSDEPLFTARLGSVGQPVPGIEFRIVTDDGSRDDSFARLTPRLVRVLAPARHVAPRELSRFVRTLVVGLERGVRVDHVDLRGFNPNLFRNNMGR